MKKRARRDQNAKRQVPYDEDLYREQVRDEILKPRSKKNDGPAPVEVDGSDHGYETEELERQGYTDYGLENPPYTNEETSPEEPDSKAPRRWKIA